MGVRTTVQPQQLGQIGGSVEIAADALADEVLSLIHISEPTRP